MTPGPRLHRPDDAARKHVHDHSADLHDCAAWNLMCAALGRVAPLPGLVLLARGDVAARAAYRRALRRHVPAEVSDPMPDCQLNVFRTRI